MAIAEPALRGFGLQRLKGGSARGGSILGTAIGLGLGIGWGLYEDYAMSVVPVNPGDIYKKPQLGVSLNGVSSQKDASTYRQRQTFRSAYKRINRSSRPKKRGHCQCCYCR